MYHEQLYTHTIYIAASMRQKFLVDKNYVCEILPNCSLRTCTSEGAKLVLLLQSDISYIVCCMLLQ